MSGGACLSGGLNLFHLLLFAARLSPKPPTHPHAPNPYPPPPPPSPPTAPITPLPTFRIWRAPIGRRRNGTDKRTRSGWALSVYPLRHCTLHFVTKRTCNFFSPPPVSYHNQPQQQNQKCRSLPVSIVAVVGWAGRGTCTGVGDGARTAVHRSWRQHRADADLCILNPSASSARSQPTNTPQVTLPRVRVSSRPAVPSATPSRLAAPTRSAPTSTASSAASLARPTASRTLPPTSTRVLPGTSRLFSR